MDIIFTIEYIKIIFISVNPSKRISSIYFSIIYFKSSSFRFTSSLIRSVFSFIIIRIHNYC